VFTVRRGRKEGERVRASFKERVDVVARIARKEKEVSKWMLAYNLNVDVTTAVKLMKAVADVYFDEFVYDSRLGVLRCLVNENEKNVTQG